MPRSKPVRWILKKRRNWRVSFFLDRVNVWPGMSILDVGCGPDGRSFELFVPDSYNITGVDLFPPEEVDVPHPNFTYLQQDARDLSQFGDQSFDLAISIGMMEHICDRTVLLDMAAEMKRVAKQLLVMVPWKYAVMEPHFFFPFFGVLPKHVQISLIKRHNLHGMAEMIRNDPNIFDENFQWLSSQEWAGIFDATDVYVFTTLETIFIIKTSKPRQRRFRRSR
ncbi:MAG: class I SAM-dependent methyltransferase [Proteobacteria bacterium]|mgnify:CR=1 FL=1|nr:class I SAM-dependent methyltransferase [Pseudomonadota bacterium]